MTLLISPHPIIVVYKTRNLVNINIKLYCYKLTKYLPAFFPVGGLEYIGFILNTNPKKITSFLSTVKILHTLLSSFVKTTRRFNSIISCLLYSKLYTWKYYPLNGVIFVVYSLFNLVEKFNYNIFLFSSFICTHKYILS